MSTIDGEGWVLNRYSWENLPNIRETLKIPNFSRVSFIRGTLQCFNSFSSIFLLLSTSTNTKKLVIKLSSISFRKVFPCQTRFFRLLIFSVCGSGEINKSELIKLYFKMLIMLSLICQQVWKRGKYRKICCNRNTFLNNFSRGRDAANWSWKLWGRWRINKIFLPKILRLRVCLLFFILWKLINS